jgi:hypothetical protein
MPRLSDSGRMRNMPKKISPELRARAVRMVAEHQEDLGRPSSPTAPGGPTHPDTAGRRAGQRPTAATSTTSASRAGPRIVCHDRSEDAEQQVARCAVTAGESHCGESGNRGDAQHAIAIAVVISSAATVERGRQRTRRVYIASSRGAACENVRCRRTTATSGRHSANERP